MSDIFCYYYSHHHHHHIVHCLLLDFLNGGGLQYTPIIYQLLWTMLENGCGLIREATLAYSDWLALTFDWLTINRFYFREEIL